MSSKSLAIETINQTKDLSGIPKTYGPLVTNQTVMLAINLLEAPIHMRLTERLGVRNLSKESLN